MKINSATLLDGQSCDFGDFNVFIGGNGVGKTTFVSELHAKSVGIARNKFRWIAQPSYDSANIASDMKLLKSSLSRRNEGGGYFYFSRAAKDANGNVDMDNNMRFAATEVNEIESKNIEVLAFDKYRRPFISLSSCDARLGLPDTVTVVGLDQPPNDPINVLYRNPNILKEIDRTIKERLNLNFILLDHTRTTLHLGLSKTFPPPFDLSKNLQEEYEKIENWKEQNFSVMSESGHGIRSLIRLLTSMLEPVNTVIMIDEPEIHLYPTHKRWLGRQLVELAKTQKKQVFLVTHDPIILQGILDANTTTNIFRIEREHGGKGVVRSCELVQFSDVTAARNQEQYLQGLFYQRCIIVEGASDRSFYQNMIEDFPQVADADLGFVPCGGKASSKHMALLATKVGLNCAFIYDLDAIFFDSETIKSVYEILGGSDNPLIDLEAVLKTDSTVQQSKDAKERNRAVKLFTGYTDANGLSTKWMQQHRTILEKTINNLAEFGIFVVPKGALESWAPEITAKVRFSELAPDVIRRDATLQRELNNFLSKVLGYLDICVDAAEL